MIRKFFDPQTGEAQTAEPPSIASLMAKHGVKSESGVVTEAPEIKIEKPAEQPQPAALAPEAPNAETITETTTKETPPPTEEPAQVKAPIEPPAPVPTWQEVLRQQPDTVLKELLGDDGLVSFVKELKEVDPKMAAFFNHWKSKGDVNDFLKELSTDYSKMSAEDVMRHQLRQEYPKASEKALEILFRNEIIAKYGLNSEDETVVEEGKILLEAVADKHRDGFIENQKKYFIPKPPEPKVTEPDQRDQEANIHIEAWRSQIEANSLMKNIALSNKFTFGEGETKFNYPVDPNLLRAVILDDNKYSETQFDIVKNQDGSVKSFTPKVEHQILTGLIAAYGTNFLDAFAAHFKDIGYKSAIAPIDNAKPQDSVSPQQPQKQYDSTAEAMAKTGVLNPGGLRR